MDPWPKLRQLLVVTGAITFLKVTKEVTKEDRNQAAVLVASIKRRLMRLALFQTPFGIVIQAERLKELRRLFRDVTHEVDAFQKDRTACKLNNFMLWERLEGNRRVAVESWVSANRSVYGVEDALEPDAGVDERPETGIAVESESGASLAAEPGPELSAEPGGLPPEPGGVLPPEPGGVLPPEPGGVLPPEPAAVEGSHAGAGFAATPAPLHAVGEVGLAAPGGPGSAESST